MSFVFANQFEIVPEHGQTAPDCAEAVMKDVTSWIEKHKRYKGQPKFILPIDGGSFNPVPGDEINIEHDFANTSHLYKLKFTHCDSDDRTMLWSTIFKIACNDKIVEISVVLRKSSTDYVIKPANLDVSRPRIIDTILRKYENRCQMNGITVPTQIIRLQEDDVAIFTQDYLLSPNRRLPIVMVSREIETELTALETPILAEDLMGLAIVTELANIEAAYELTRNMGGKHLSCYNGAVRVYWPGLTNHSEPFEHTLFLANDIYDNNDRGKPLGQYLFRVFSEIVSLRFTDGQVIRQAREDISQKILTDNKKRSADLDTMRLELRDKHQLSTEAEEIIDLYTNDNKGLKLEVERFNKRIDELVEENKNLRDNWNSYKEYGMGSGREGFGMPESDNFEPSSILSALQVAKTRHSDILEIWSDAEESAKESMYANYMEVHEALTAIAKIGRLRLEANEAGVSMGGDWRALMKIEGFECQPHESPTTINKFGNDRVFRDRSTAQSNMMLMHIKLGTGGPDNCLRIHFWPNDETQKVCIGHCGEHRKIASRS